MRKSRTSVKTGRPNSLTLIWHTSTLMLFKCEGMQVWRCERLANLRDVGHTTRHCNETQVSDDTHVTA